MAVVVYHVFQFHNNICDSFDSTYELITALQQKGDDLLLVQIVAKARVAAIVPTIILLIKSVPKDL